MIQRVIAGLTFVLFLVACSGSQSASIAPTGESVIHTDVSLVGNVEGQTVNNEHPQSIGQASMKEDGTIVLRLRAETDDGVVGEALFTYSPIDENYDSILQHLGGLNPGETKPVPPWPDD
jgi:hypothetical protein